MNEKDATAPSTAVAVPQANEPLRLEIVTRMVGGHGETLARDGGDPVGVAKQPRMFTGRALPAIVVLLAAVLGGACGSVAAAGTPCPAPSLDRTTEPTFEDAAPTAYYLLVDRALHADARRAASYDWPRLPRTAFAVITELLPLLALHPGDVLVGSYVAHDSGDPREVFLPIAQVPRVAPPALGARPAAPEPPLNRLDCNDYRERVAAYNAAAASWQKVADAQRTAWEQERHDVVRRFVAGALKRVEGLDPAPDRAGTDLYGALGAASGVFGTHAPARGKLIAFTDATDSVGHDVVPQLEGADIVFALFHRSDPGDAQRDVKMWTERLRSFGARRTAFVDWNATTATKIAQLLKEETR